MKQHTHILIYSLLVLALLMAPLSVTHAGIIPCGTPAQGGEPAQPDCDFAYLFKLIANIIDFLLFKLAVPLAAIAFAWAGVLFVVYSGNDSKRSQAKDIIWFAILGLALALAAWLIVNTIFTTLTTIQLT